MLSKVQVKHIVKLARLGLTEKEIAKMQKELAVILDYIEQLNQVDVSKAALASESVAIKNALRPDEANPEHQKTVEAMLAQAPDREGDYVKVKPVF